MAHRQQIHITETPLGEFHIVITGVTDYTIPFDTTRRLYERLAQKLPSRRRSMAKHCLDKWRAIKNSGFDPKVVHIQTNVPGEWVACWEIVVKGKRKAIYPSIVDFIAFLPPSEHSQAEKYFRSRGAVF